MIDRRRPILSAIANRRMFMGGGMVAPMPQPTYMDLMPQQMGIPREAQGIMASSQPLVDAIAGDANNPAGGDTLSMAQGGVAQFDRGGVGRIRGGAPTRGPATQLGLGAAPEEMERRRKLIAGGLGEGMRSELVREMFPYSASTGRSFLGPEMMRPGIVGSDPSGETSPLQRGGQFVLDFIDQAGRGLSQVSNAFARTLVDVGEGLVTKAPSDVSSSTILSQVSAVNDALRRLPEVPGFSDEDVSQTIKDIAEAATTQNPNISGDELSARLAEGLVVKFETPDTGLETGERGDGSPIPNRLLGEGPETDFPEDAGAGAEFGLRPDTEGPFDVEGEIDPDDDSDVPRPIIKKPEPPVREGDADTGAATAARAEADTDKSTPAKQILETFNKKDMPEEEAVRTIEDYKREFVDQMPEYQGMSEEEKGFALMEAGLRVAAGESPNAITNIAKGLQGLGAQFAKDDKEKREWDRTVNLSAAKYALANTKQDRTAAAALAKERRARVEYVANKAGKDPRSGRAFKKGDVLTFTAGEVHDGILDNFAAGTVVLPKTFSDIQDGVAAADKLLRAGKIKYSEYQQDRKDYATATKNLLSGLQMKLLIGDAAKIIKTNPRAITGATSFLKRATDDVLNALDIQEKDRSGYLAKLQLSDSAQYQAIMKRIGTKMITQILNEGNRTVSDADRKRVDELVGAYGDYFSGFAASEGALRIKLEGLARDIDSGIQEAQASMDLIEGEYNNRLNADRYNRLQRYKRTRFGRFQSKDYDLFRIGDDGVYRRQESP